MNCSFPMCLTSSGECFAACAKAKWERLAKENKSSDVVIPDTDLVHKQPWYVSHAETMVQNVIGQINAFFILWLYGIPFDKRLQLQVVFFIMAYGRGIAVRRTFEWLRLK